MFVFRIFIYVRPETFLYNLSVVFSMHWYEKKQYYFQRSATEYVRLSKLLKDKKQYRKD